VFGPFAPKLRARDESGSTFADAGVSPRTGIVKTTDFPPVLDHDVKTSDDSHRGLIILLGAMSALGPMTVDMYLPALPQIVRDLATNETAVQATLTGSLLGMALGQLLMGPISDSIGRRRSILIGLGIHVVFSVFSALAPGVGTLILFRALQGLGSAAAVSVAIAIVRDISTGRAASIRYSMMMFISTAAPIVAPMIGSAVLIWADWHGVFLVQGAMSLVLVVVTFFVLPETAGHRRPLFSQNPLAGFTTVVRDRVFVGSALSQSLMMAASFCYIAGLSFVAQDWYGVSEQAYGLILSGGAVVMLFMNRISPWLLRRHTPHRVSLIGLAGALLSAGFMMLSAFTVGLAGVAVTSWICIGFQQLITPNNQAMALSKHGAHAGVAAAIVGAASSAAAAGAAPFMGMLGVDGGFKMGASMFGFYLLSALASTLITGFRHDRDEPEDEPGPASA